jgi:hypothetical protein
VKRIVVCLAVAMYPNVYGTGVVCASAISPPLHTKPFWATAATVSLCLKAFSAAALSHKTFLAAAVAPPRCFWAARWRSTSETSLFWLRSRSVTIIVVRACVVPGLESMALSPDFWPPPPRRARFGNSGFCPGIFGPRPRLGYQKVR